MRRASLFLLAMAAALPAMAATVPAPSPLDRRIRIVEYNPLDVYELTAHYGYELQIALSPGEIITNVHTGDEAAWTIGPKDVKNRLWVKPKADNPTTNLSIVSRTTKGEERTYDFHLTAAWPSDKQDGNREMMYRVQFTYPDDERAATQATKQVSDVKEKLANAATTKPRNYKYSFAGNSIFKPDEIYDDGLYTYLRFPANTPRPSIYYVDANDAEHIAETHTDEEWIVIHSVRTRFLFRKDEVVSGVFNDGFNNTGTFNRSGTVSPAVRRVVKGGE